jgi:hypothetical protein
MWRPRKANTQIVLCSKMKIKVNEGKRRQEDFRRNKRASVLNEQEEVSLVADRPRKL